MASRTVTDRGVDNAAVIFEKNGGGALTCDVQVRDSSGVQHTVRVDLSSLTAGERAALPGVLLKLYNAALTAAGFAD